MQNERKLSFGNSYLLRMAVLELERIIRELSLWLCLADEKKMQQKGRIVGF